MNFEFDPAKSRANVRKHGIGFSEARLLWLDEDRIEIPARTVGESRFLLIARLSGQHWSAIFTLRDKRIRIISVRRSRPEEIALYEGEGVRQ